MNVNELERRNKDPQQAFTTEFRELAIEKVKSGQSIVWTARVLGMVSEIGLRQPLKEH
jgi:hypothetical protein